MKVNLLVLLFSLITIVSYAQREVVGTVKDETNQPLPGVNVLLRGTTQGVVTDINGTYKLGDLPAEGVLSFSFIGYTTQEVVVAGKTVIDIKLLPDLTSLEEVVVIGYGTQKKTLTTAPIAKVDAKDLGGVSVPRVDQMLQGQIAGVTFKSSSGQPGSAMNIFIRGIGTNGNNNPLIIVDGLNTNDGILASLNPDDIESVEVLKDGASAAIYGTRAANGVILVTTKKAKSGQVSLNYSTNYGVQQPWRIPSMLNSSQYVDLTREKYQNGGSSLPLGFPDQNNIPANTNWMKEIFQKGTTQTHQLSFAKGSESGSLNGSLSYYDQKGVIAPAKSNSKRITARFNSDQKINNFLSFGENIFLQHSVNNRIPENSEFGTPIGDALAYDPITPVHDASAQYGFAQSPYVQKEYVNPLSRIFISNTTNTTDEIAGNAFFKITPLKNLTFKSDLGVDYLYYTGRGFSPSYQFTPAFFNTINDIYQYETKAYRWQWENYATYSKSIQNHSFDVTAGTTVQERIDGISFGASSSGIQQEVQLDPNYWYITNTPDSLQRSSSSKTERIALRSYFARINYNYSEKYLLMLSLRRDGSSQFGSNYPYGYFPAASAGWVVSREQFWPKTMVNFFKIRGSYGINGSDRIGTLSYASTIVRTGDYPFGKPGNQTIYNGYSGSYYPNPNIKWEQSKQLDVGVEVGLFNDKLTFEFDYYNKTTAGLLMQATVVDLGGAAPPTANVGSVVNKGFELEANYRQNIGKFNTSFKLTAATLTNTVTKVNGDGYIDGYTWPIRNTVITRMEVGKPIGFFRGYKTDGVFHNESEIFGYINSNGDPIQPGAKPGDLKYVDTSGDGKIDIKDVVKIGSPWAKYTLGLNVNVAYKGFDLRLLFASTIGNKVYRSYERQDVINTNYRTTWLDRWSESNPNGKYPRLTTNDTNNNSRPSDFYVENASFLRLRNLQIGYKIPSAILNKVKLTSFRIYASADNLITLTKYTGFDPEIGTSGWILDTGIDKGFYPQMKAVSVGLNVAF